jgi:adenosylcobinamide-phosphate synthase
VIWVAALGLDFVAGEPPAWMHPTVATGALIGALERPAPTTPSRQLAYGAALVGLPMAASLGVGWLVGRLPRWLRLPVELALLKSSFALSSLLAAGARIERDLERGEPGTARGHLRDLVSRPTATLDRAHIASAAIESLAENLSDSYVAPMLFFRLAGLGGALVYRAVNTADAMVGYRGRYEFLGKAAARLDDVVNFVPARVSAVALVAASPLVGLRGGAALRVGLRHHRRTASPNAGWPMAVVAGACEVRLEKLGQYVLGEGASPGAADICRARRLVLAAAVLATVAALALPRGRPWR